MAAEAARSNGTAGSEPEASPTGTAGSSSIPAVRIDEPQRPLLVPEPARNENDALAAERPRAAGRRRPRTARLVARVLLAPIYIAIAAGSALILVLAAKTFLGL